MRPVHRIQTSTSAGATSMFGGILLIFNNVKVDDIASVFQDLTCGEVFGMVLPIVGGVWGMMHNEKPKEIDDGGS